MLAYLAFAWLDAAKLAPIDGPRGWLKGSAELRAGLPDAIPVEGGELHLVAPMPGSSILVDESSWHGKEFISLGELEEQAAALTILASVTAGPQLPAVVRWAIDHFLDKGEGQVAHLLRAVYLYGDEGQGIKALSVVGEDEIGELFRVAGSNPTRDAWLIDVANTAGRPDLAAAIAQLIEEGEQDGGHLALSMRSERALGSLVISAFERAKGTRSNRQRLELIANYCASHFAYLGFSYDPGQHPMQIADTKWGAYPVLDGVTVSYLSSLDAPSPFRPSPVWIVAPMPGSNLLVDDEGWESDKTLCFGKVSEVGAKYFAISILRAARTLPQHPASLEWALTFSAWHHIALPDWLPDALLAQGRPDLLALAMAHGVWHPNADTMGLLAHLPPLDLLFALSWRPDIDPPGEVAEAFLAQAEDVTLQIAAFACPPLVKPSFTADIERFFGALADLGSRNVAVKVALSVPDALLFPEVEQTLAVQMSPRDLLKVGMWRPGQHSLPVIGQILSQYGDADVLYQAGLRLPGHRYHSRIEHALMECVDTDLIQLAKDTWPVDRWSAAELAFAQGDRDPF